MLGKHLCTSPLQVEQILIAHALASAACCVRHTGGYDAELEGALAAGHVGAPLQPGDRALLRLRPLRHYEAGELVAVKRRLAATAPAAAAAEARAAQGPGTGPAGAAGSSTVDEGGVVLCYGRVAVDAAPQPGQAAYRLSVEVSPGVYESLLSIQVRAGPPLCRTTSMKRVQWHQGLMGCKPRIRVTSTTISQECTKACLYA
jgi:hypothetical protein